jgi:hypothetical protein
VVPLVQRHTEQIALEAFSEPRSLYRLSPAGPPADVAAAAGPRPAVQVVAEAVRAALQVDEVELGAIPVLASSELDPRQLGFSDRERRLLQSIDGEASLEVLLLGSGLRQETALRAMAVARVLGLITLRPADRTQTPLRQAPELDLKRLDAKFEEIQESDYFAILGLPRTAGGEEVERAFLQLASEFHPLKFAGHPDHSVHRRAEVIQSLLSEAAQALQDDRLRSEYARNLLD